MLVLCTLLVVFSAAQGCSQIFTDMMGVITSPGYPDNYPDDQECFYVILRPEGERITLIFEHFDLENGTWCHFDFLEIHDGNSGSSPYMTRRCGWEIPPIIRSFQSSMWIRFHSDGSLNATGFRAVYISGVLLDQFFLVTSTKGRIYRIDYLTLSQIIVPLPSINKPVAVDYDPVERRIYWSDLMTKQIVSADASGSDVRVVRQFDRVASVEGIAIDPVSRLVFYTDEGSDVIAMIAIPGGLHLTIISTDLDKPRDIVLDTKNGVMFWSDWGMQEKIERANYDGTDRRAIHTSDLLMPNGLAIDANNSRLYWVDAGTDKVETSDLEGRNRRVLYSVQGSHFFGLTYYNDELYVTDWTGAGSQTNVSFIHKFESNGLGSMNVATVMGRMDGIHLYSEDDWYRGPNQCSIGNGGCSHICIPSSGDGFKCLCPDKPTDCQMGEEAHAEYHSRNEGAVVGAVVGVVCFVIILIAAIVFWRRKRSQVPKPEVNVTYNRLDEAGIHDNPYMQPVVTPDTQPHSPGGNFIWT